MLNHPSAPYVLALNPIARPKLHNRQGRPHFFAWQQSKMRQALSARHPNTFFTLASDIDIPLSGPPQREDDSAVQPCQVEIRHVTVGGPASHRSKVLSLPRGQPIPEGLEIRSAAHAPFEW